MHDIPRLVADIQTIAYSPRGNPAFIQSVMGGGVPAIIHALPHLQALSEPSDTETEVLRKTCEQIIASQWGWPYPDEDGAPVVTSLTLATKTFTLDATGLAAGDKLMIRMTTTVNDTATGTAVIAIVKKTSMLLTTQG